MSLYLHKLILDAIWNFHLICTEIVRLRFHATTCMACIKRKVYNVKVYIYICSVYWFLLSTLHNGKELLRYTAILHTVVISDIRVNWYLYYCWFAWHIYSSHNKPSITLIWNDPIISDHYISNSTSQFSSISNPSTSRKSIKHCICYPTSNMLSQFTGTLIHQTIQTIHIYAGNIRQDQCKAI